MLKYITPSFVVLALESKLIRFSFSHNWKNSTRTPVEIQSSSPKLTYLGSQVSP